MSNRLPLQYIHCISIIVCICVIAIPAYANTKKIDPKQMQFTNYADSLETMAVNIEAQYPIEEKANEIARTLRSAAQDGTIAIESSEEDFMVQVNEVLWASAHDLHLKVYNKEGLAAKYQRGGARAPRLRAVKPGQAGGGPTMGEGAIGTTKIESSIVADGIGLLTITSAIYRNEELYEAALNPLSSTESIVIDLRSSPGGTSGGVQYFLSQFYGEETHLSSRLTRLSNTPQETWSIKTFMSEIFANKTLYVLTSKQTASGAESVAFALKNTNRAILIGEKTAGAGNAGAILPIGHDLSLFLPISQTIDPKSGQAWEGTGVEPHVSVPAKTAFDEALRIIDKST